MDGRGWRIEQSSNSSYGRADDRHCELRPNTLASGRLFIAAITGSGSNGTFTAVFTHSRGSSQLYLGYILFLPTSNIVWYTAKGSCLIEYNRISNGMRLINDPGTGWLGPISGVPLGPNAGTLSNSQCTVNLSGASASIGPSTMTVTVPVTFKNAVSPVMATFLQAADVKDNWTGMTQFGNWTLSSGTARNGPSITGITSSATTGSSAVYSIGAGHTGGVSALKHDSSASERPYSWRCSLPGDLFPFKQYVESH